ncbi:hypothetical protein BDZ94DRAFT_1228150 [Collybia nuda]|uniref:Chromo domain-containing protein n=1 Tax=Collybia nuda TaxID=64659 RepID=A0A9P6C9F5_9AGAR|nr:hypothetical protein BDZ94DRAFT_1228150 [Collybia nuda]
MSHIYPVFYIVKLLPASRNLIPGHQPTIVPGPTNIDGEEEFRYEVEEVMDSHFFCNKLHYLVAWKGYGYEQNSWEVAITFTAMSLSHFFIVKTQEHLDQSTTSTTATSHSNPFVRMVSLEGDSGGIIFFLRKTKGKFQENLEFSGSFANSFT